MAAGRRGGYRGKEFEHHESDLGMLKKEIGDSNGYYGGMRNRNGEYERGQSRVRDGLDHGVRQKDIKEREQMNGGYLSSSSFSHSGSGGGSRRRGHSSRTIDREPGELSSDGSDGSFDSKIAVNKEIEFRNMDNGIHLSLVQNKRKFSPIVWDREDRVLSRPVNSKHITGTANLPPPPPPPLARSHQSSNSNPSTNADVQTSAPDDAASHIYEVPPSKINSLPDLPEIPVETSSSLPEESWVSKLGITAVDDNEDYMPTRTVITSRWENEADTDEGEISHHEDRWIKRRSVSELNGVRVKKKFSPELVDVEREGSTGTRGRSSESDERVRSSSRDSYSDNDDKHVYMEISDGLKYVGASVSESDSEFEDDAPLPNRRVNMLQCCRSVTEFEYLNKIDEGTYGIVSRAKDTITGEIVALKKVKMEKEKDGFPLTSLREINILLSFNHPSIVDVKEVVMGESRTDIPDGICGDSIFMVMEYMEHDLKGLMETMKQPFSQSEVKCLMRQLLRGVKYLHDNWVLHRDLKTSNILFNNRGKLKICDFGLARQYGSPLKPYTQLVVTLWYRAPELLLGAKQYSTSIDMWSVGCIMAELLTKQPLFNGKSELDQLDKIFRVLGTPNETIWPGCTKLPGYKVNFVRHQYSQLRKKFPATSFTGSPVLSDTGFDLLTKLLTYDPEKRITAEAALNHKWFSEVPLPKSKKFMPTYPALHAQDRRLRRVWKSPDPLEEQRRKELQGEIGTGGLFGL